MSLTGTEESGPLRVGPPVVDDMTGGTDTDGLLRELGYDGAAIADLAHRGIVSTRSEA